MAGVIVDNIEGQGIALSVPLTADGAVRLTLSLELDETARLVDQLNYQLLQTGYGDALAEGIDTNDLTLQDVVQAWLKLRTNIAGDPDRHPAEINWALHMLDSHAPWDIEEPQEPISDVDGGIYSAVEAKRRAAEGELEQ